VSNPPPVEVSIWMPGSIHTIAPGSARTASRLASAIWMYWKSSPSIL
jgi:hypothetical protein